jgi:hypothetical protein
MKIVPLLLQIAFSDDEPLFETARVFAHELVDGGMDLGRRGFRLNRVQLVAIGNQEIDLIKVMIFGSGFSVKGMVMGMMATADKRLAHGILENHAFVDGQFPRNQPLVNRFPVLASSLRIWLINNPCRKDTS